MGPERRCGVSKTLRRRGWVFPIPSRGAGTYIKRGKRASIWAALREDTPWFTLGGPENGPFHRLDLPPALYYRRIARPLNNSFAHPKNPGAGEERDTIAVGAGQARALTHHLDRICQTVQVQFR